MTRLDKYRMLSQLYSDGEATVTGTRHFFWFPRSCVTAIKLSAVGAGRARDDGVTTLQSLCKYRGHGPLLRSVDVLNPAWESIMM